MQRDGPKVMHHDTHISPDGEQVNRLVLDVNGHNVQVIQYDANLNVLVYVDEHARMIHIDNAAQFIAGRTDGG